MAGRATPNTQQLAAAVNARRSQSAKPVTVRRLETWTGEGLIPSPAARGLGRNAPSRSMVDVDGSVGLAVEVADLLDNGATTNEALLTLFMSGRPVDPRRVRAAYRSVAGDTERWIRSRDNQQGSAGTTVAEVAADRIAPRVRRTTRLEPLRRWARNERSAGGGSVEDALKRVITDVLSFALHGVARTPRGQIEVLEATGVTAALNDRLPGHRPPLRPAPSDLLPEVFAALRLHEIARIITAAEWHEVETARDDVQTLIVFAQAFAPVAEAQGTRTAFGFSLIATSGPRVAALAVPAMLVLRRMRPAEVEHFASFARDETPRFAAANALLTRVPDRHRHRFRSSTTDEAATVEFDAEFVQIIEQFRHDEPGHFAALRLEEMSENS